MKPQDIRNRLADIDNAIFHGEYLFARGLVAGLSEEIFVSEDDKNESYAANLGDFGIAKEIDEEVVDEKFEDEFDYEHR